MTNHLTHVYPNNGTDVPSFAQCDCGFLTHCDNHDAALEAGRLHLETVLTDREHVLAAQIRRDGLRLADAIELVTALGRAIDGAQNELNELGKAGAA